MPAQRDNTSIYRYFLYDLLSDTFLAEIPFKGVSYGRALREAGAFSASIPVIDATMSLDLYNSTMPGKTALYVVKNDKCVWGGLIWSRNYNIITRTLSVNANEFTSYLHHRAVWQTWSNSYAASIEIVNGVGNVTITNGSYEFTHDMPIFISFSNENVFKYSGYYAVLSSPAPSSTSFSFDASQWYNSDTDSYDVMPNFKDDGCTVDVRSDTYHYMREMLDELMIDFSNLNFANIDIEPGISRKFMVQTASRSFNSTTNKIEATLTVDADHWAVVGQKIKITNVGSDFDGIYTISDIPNQNQFVFENPGSNVSSYSVSGKVASIIAKEVGDDGSITLTTDGPHGFQMDDVVDITNVDNYIDGTYLIDSVDTSDTFVITGYASTTKKTAVVGGTAKVSPLVIYGEYGSFSANSNLNLKYSNYGYSGFSKQNAVIRGHELHLAGELLDSFSSQLNGFEYRIDCDYDKATNTFSKTMVFLPYKPQSYTDYLNTLPGGKLPIGQSAPPSALGADRIVFEHPGNILEASMEESAEDAATRVWYSGGDTSLGADASQPYSGASANDYLGGLEFPWPILDSVQKPPIQNLGEASLYQYAEQYLFDSLPPISTFVVSVNGSISPEVGTYSPGDWCSIRLDDRFVQQRLDSHLEPRSDILVRKIDSYTVSVPDTPTFPEKVQLQLITESQVDKIGSAKTS
jgi:hypothetical protein